MFIPHIINDATGTDFPQAEYDRIAAYFEPPAFETGLPDEIDRSDPDFAVWLDQNVAAHNVVAVARRVRARLLGVKKRQQHAPGFEQRP